MNLKEAYSILELSPDAPADEAKKKYRDLTKKYHPDVNKDSGAEDKFKKINEAYKLVTTGEDEQPHHFQSQSSWNPFAGFQRQQRVEATHVELHTTISFKDSVFGCKQELKFSRNGKCDSCEGQGFIALNNGCDKCGGKGEVVQRQGNMIIVQTCSKCHGNTKSEKCKVCQGAAFQSTEVSVQVQIPGGVINGNILRLGGMGNYAGNFMGADQFTDAHLHINVESETDLSLVGNDVICNLEISLLEALRGCHKSVKTVIGSKDIVIKPKSRNKEEVIISHMGVGRIGNQRIILDVKYPDNTDKLISVLIDEVS